MNDHSRGRVLYVAGMGRSGSTLLERAVSQLPNTCGIGESVYMWERGVVNNEHCGCALPFHSCPFWVEVGKVGFGGWARLDTKRIAQLQRAVDDVKHVPRMILRSPGAKFRAETSEYASYYLRLYDAVRQVSGCDVVVDSSKVTSLAYVLSLARSIDLRMIHIVRDPRAVAFSWTKVVRRPEVTSEVAFMPRYSTTYMASLYAGHSVLLEALKLRGVPTLRVRYEDFADEPLRSLRLIAGFAGLRWDRDAVLSTDDHTLLLNIVHTASGNPSRFRTGDIEVRRDDSWVDLMPARQKRVVSALTVPLLAKYNYRFIPRAGTRLK